MIEELEQIETESIEELIELKKQSEVLSDRLDRLAEEHGSVSQVVLDRVQTDYETQVAELEKQAAPLKEQARKELKTIQELWIAAQDTLQVTGLTREELELRHSVGEFDDEEFNRFHDEVVEKEAEQKQDLAKIESVRGRFAAALGSDGPPAGNVTSELEEKPLPSADSELARKTYETQESSPMEAVKEAERASEDPAMSQEKEHPAETGPQEGEGRAVTAAGPDEDAVGESIPQPPSPIEENPPGGTVILPVPPPPGEGPEVRATRILHQARLVPVEPIAGGSEFPIEPISTIGRTKENLIRVDEAAVSRNHSEITLTQDGYLLRDLESENGTYVNGDRIESRLLAEGDRIQIGTVRFVFYGATP